MTNPLNVPSELIPMDAETLHELVTSFIFVSIDALHAELQQIRTLLPGVLVPEVRPETSTSNVMALGECVGNALSFAFAPTDDELRYALSHLPPSQIQLLTSRLRQIAHRLVQLEEDHHCQLLAVSPVWHKRWRLLIEGQLHPAYIGGMFF
ncbi:hypothetical protein L5M38_02820 [Shewanella sp. SM101]|uniref:hypothetical protein n=1 Tax=unclassified Shewanella TaxID=196818 RepID=UPI0021D94A21|nr:hypothetical protein [Shewanella sp. SM101]MCU8103486.1 hypothetical protein [Shewanella sp. SM101]